MDNKGYFVVHKWMASELGLKGTDLFVYAIVYGFTQIEEQSFFGTRRYLAEFIGVSIPTIQRSLDSLVESGLLIRNVSEMPVNGMRVVSYKANLNPRYQNEPGIKMIHNDIIHKSISNTVNTRESSNTRRFIKPTIEEVAAYCREKGYFVDASQFVDYYESNGWKVGRTPMKDWRAAVRTWDRNERKRKGVPLKKTPKMNWGEGVE